MAPILYIVIPCYNEEEVLPVMMPVFLEKLKQLEQDGKIAPSSRLLFVDDGSSDHTWELIRTFAAQEIHAAGIRQSRNRGHQSSLLAGMMEAVKFADVIITMDCDGQDDIQTVDEMLEAYGKGADVVYGIRRDRQSDTFGKQITAEIFYRVMNWLGVETKPGHGDYRLVSARVVHALAQFGEANLFLRGIVPLAGFQSTSVYYERQERAAGKTHYTVRKMMSLALDGITGFSIRPIRLIAALGLLFSVFGFGAVVWTLFLHFSGNTVDGWTSMMYMAVFLGGIQLLSLGVIGEYIGRIYMETKRRPRYILSEYTGDMYAQQKAIHENPVQKSCMETIHRDHT